ncbi:carboxypeptidase family protein [Pedobacter duraquae]|uniref:Carboxypeptidase family protein n=2 Tax=Pedobacter duraquae TaxID=425511 RepID=A0A4R6IKK9_9SPHI|nr:carboxypeptidase family protein [Pedobacter duraquae]
MLLLAVSGFAQNKYLVKGTTVDTAARLKLLNSSISVLNAKDSTLKSFTRTAADGSFEINKLQKGKYILMVTYPGYADYIEAFTLDSTKSEKDFGTLHMLLKSKLLEDVLIKGTAAAIKINGDTTEFNAAAYTIQPNSKVEDLLKQLPGIQVDKDGKITAQGKTVSKVLVDGEEFFGDDPTLVTKNIRGDMVDKVQLFEKKSDQAAFTGIDDGQKSQTINIKLKEDKKNGYFGKLDAGIGNDGYYETQAQFNRFKGKMKFSAYGTLSNTGKTGLSWQDNSKMNSGGMEILDNGIIMISGGGGSDELDSFDGRYTGDGIPVAASGGLHYDTKWDSDKKSINTNFKTGAITIDGAVNTISQNNLPSGVIISNSDQTSHNYIFRNKLDATYQIKLDSMSNLKISVDGMAKKTNTSTGYIARSFRGDDTRLNASDRTVSNDGTQQVFNASAFYTKKFRKKGRTLSLNLSEAIRKNESTGFLRSDNTFYATTGAFEREEIVDQLKTVNANSNILTGNLTYTEPIAKYLSIVFNYGLSMNQSISDRKSFNKSASGNYDMLDTQFSNDFKLTQIGNQGGAIANFNRKKTVINIGTKVALINFDQLDRYTNNKFDRNFVNWNPQASYQYKISSQQSFSIRYSGSTRQPSVDQIQPVRVNTDPLNVTLGNENLRPSFTNNFSAYYDSYKVIGNRSLYASINYSFTENSIVSNTTTDLEGRSTFQSINLTGKRPSNYYGYLSYYRKMKIFTDINVGLSGNLNKSTSFNYVTYNGKTELNQNSSGEYSANLSLSKNVEKKFSAYVNGGPNYSTGSSSIQKELNNDGWGFRSRFSATGYLPAKFEISTDGDYLFRGATKSFDEDFTRLIWNASVSRKFLKGDQLKASIKVNDLLNQNTGFNRSASGNFITQTSSLTIQRYFMCSVTWDFNKMGK